MISQFDYPYHILVIGPTGDVKTGDKSRTAIKSLPITVIVKDLQLLNCCIMLTLCRATKILQIPPMESLSYGKVNMVYQGAGKIEETDLHDLPTQ